MLSELAVIHQALAAVVAPATPRTILLLAEESAHKHFFSFMGPVPLVRHMMLAAIVSLIGVVTIGLSSEVDQRNMSLSLLQLSGMPLFMIEKKFNDWVLVCAGLGIGQGVLEIPSKC